MSAALTPTEQFEQLADAFFRETGMMAPGKDQPGELGGPSYGVRWAEYMNWLERRRYDGLLEQCERQGEVERCTSCGEPQPDEARCANCGRHGEAA